MSEEEVYTWPLLSRKDIAQCLSELHIQISEQDLAKPQPDKIRMVYYVMVEFLTGRTKEDFENPTSAIDQIEFPELHLDAVAEQNFHRALKQLMRAVLVNDFSIWRDLYHPTPNRTVYILSAIINFAKYRESQLASYNELSLQTETLLDSKQNLLDEIAKLEEEKRRLEAERERELPTLEMLRKETEELGKTIGELNVEQAKRRAETSEMKKETAQIKQRTAEVKMMITTTSQEIARTRAHIVQSPQRMKQTLSALGERVESQKNDIVATEKECRDLQARAEILNKLEKDVAHCCELMGQTQDESNKMKMAKNKIKDLKEQIKEQQQAIREYESQRNRLERQKASAEERLQRLEGQQKAKEAATKAKLDAITAENMTINRDRNETRASIESNYAKTRIVERKIEELEQRQALEMQRISEVYGELENKVHMYHKKLYEAIGVDGSHIFA